MSAGEGRNASPRRFLRWALLAALLCAIPAGIALALTRAPELPVLWTLPAWSLTDQDGAAFGAANLRGKVYIANFVFTSCVASCPRLSRQMSHLQPEAESLGGRLHLVSITVDPQNDTPARLHEYATRFHADPRVWTFVTGPADTVITAVERGFGMGVQEPTRGPNGAFNPIELAHANRFALVDAQGRLRGAYDADDDEAMAKLVSDARALVAAAH